MRHELVRLAGLVDWRFFDQRFSALYAEAGRPGVATRLMVGLHLLTALPATYLCHLVDAARHPHT